MESDYPEFVYTPGPWVWQNGELRRLATPFSNTPEVILCPQNTCMHEDIEEDFKEPLGKEYWLRVLGSVNTEDCSPWNSALLRCAPEMFEALKAISEGEGCPVEIATQTVKSVMQP